MTIEQIKAKIARLQNEMNRIEDEKGFQNVPSALRMELWDMNSKLRSKLSGKRELVTGVKEALDSLTIRS